MAEALTDCLLPGSEGAALDAARHLLACVSGNCLHLQDLPAHLAFLPFHMPASAWGHLEAHARDAVAEGLTTVHLPRPTSGEALQALCLGLNALPSLRQAVLPVPARGQHIDLSGLPAREGGLSLLLECEHPEPHVQQRGGWQVLIPPGWEARACGAAAGTAHLEKATVQVVAADGAVSAAKTLADFNYFRRPGDSKGVVPDGPFAFLMSPAEAMASVNLNGAAEFSIRESNAIGLWEPRIVCRHLSVQWLADRAEHLQNKTAHTPGRSHAASAKPQRHSMAAFRTKAGIEGHVPVSTQTQFDAWYSGPPVATCSPAALGRSLRALAMGLHAPAARQVLLVTATHAMGVELQVKEGAGGRAEYAVLLYDPNRTATHLRQRCSSLESLARVDLGKLLTRPGARDAQAMLDAYCGPDQPQLVALYERPSAARAESAAATVVVLDAQEEARLSPDYLHQMLEFGVPDEIRACVSAMTTQPPLDAATLSMRLAAATDGLSGYTVMIKSRRWTGAVGYAQAIMQAPGLVARQRYSLLASPRMPFLHRALDTPIDPTAVAGFARAVLGGEAGALEFAQRVSLLQIHRRPALHVTVQAGMDSADRAAGRQAAYHLAREIAASPALVLREKCVLLGKRTGGIFSKRSAASDAVRQGNPEAALAMVAGVLGAGQDQATTQRLLSSLGLNVPRLLRAQVRQGISMGSPWLGLVLQSLNDRPVASAAYTDITRLAASQAIARRTPAPIDQ
ncbi:ShET2/EspL2 family type III secretion system effector toxin [Ramlibacter sp. AN1015]|uniref:ShET2/EspL2 family type III secretion system effector toxin n=1 Tax=Ramlibacter sp. AN1015 TaxID=3133428 RepID=UPI0030BB71E6